MPSDAKKDPRTIFRKLETLLRRHAGGLVARKTYLGSRGKIRKPGYHLYGRKELFLGGRRPQPIYFAGVVAGRHSANLYVMPIYSHPNAFPSLPSELQKFRSGKSCFAITHMDEDLLVVIDALLGRGKALYRREGWI